MNKLILTLIAIMTLGFVTCAQNNGKNHMQNKKKALVVYFSATGNTAQKAKMIAEVTKGDLCEIAPSKPYSSTDLDWNNRQSRSSVEMNDSKARPELQKTDIDMSAYNCIFIGYTIWWNQAPRIINTFIESYNLKGKKLIPFATSGGSGINNSVRELKNTYTDLEWDNGRLLNSANSSAIQDWVNEVMAE